MHPGPLTGHCLCGAVRFALAGPIAQPTTCHCGQCRRQTGYVWASVDVTPEQLTLLADAGLRWYRSSPTSRRGFCGDCGSFLFWADDAGTYLGVSAGALDAPTGLTLDRHTWVGSEGDFYTIADGLPQEEEETP